MLSPIDAIMVSTRKPADWLGVETIEPGQTADPTATAGDPLVDISAGEGLDWVFKGGQFVN